MDQQQQEILELSKDYKKVFNHADMLITQMPHILDKMQLPEVTSEYASDYDKGFRDRLDVEGRDKSLDKGFSVDQLRKKYARDMSYKKDKGLDLDKD